MTKYYIIQIPSLRKTTKITDLFVEAFWHLCLLIPCLPTITTDEMKTHVHNTCLKAISLLKDKAISPVS